MVPREGRAAKDKRTEEVVVDLDDLLHLLRTHERAHRRPTVHCQYDALLELEAQRGRALLEVLDRRRLVVRGCNSNIHSNTLGFRDFEVDDLGGLRHVGDLPHRTFFRSRDLAAVKVE